jgi:ABC-2 type transport system permease protein
MSRLIKAEIFKLRKRSMTLVLLFILLGAIILLLSIMQTVAQSNGQGVHFLKDAISSVVLIFSSVGLILAVILVADNTGSEYRWNTLRPYLLCSESRLKMFSAKLITAVIFIIAGMLIGVLTAVLLGIIFTAIRGFSWDLSFFTLSFIGRQLLTFLRTLYVILPYALLAFLFAVLGRSTAAGIGLGIGVSVVESIFTGLMPLAHGWLGKIPNYLLTINVQVINSLAQSDTLRMGTNSHLPSPLHAFIVVAIYCVVFIAISFALFQKRDVTG